MVSAPTFFIGLLCLVGAVLRGWSVGQVWWRVWRASRYPQISAEILQAYLERTTPESEPDHLQRFFPHVAVRFDVRGRTYRVVQERESMPVHAAEDYIAQFEPGRYVRVFYNPDDPYDAYIEPHDPTLARQLYLLAVAAVAGVVLIVMSVV
jgi:hypothetical protein